jgi:hypothetical protein
MTGTGLNPRFLSTRLRTFIARTPGIVPELAAFVA